MSLRRRLAADRAATWVLTLAGLASVAVLLGIFTLLATEAVSTFTGGIELQPLTEAERAALPPEVVSALDARHVAPPTPVHMATSTVWRPSGHPPEYGLLALLAGTLLTTVGAMAIAVPIGLATAAWLAFEAKGAVRDTIKFGVELVAAIPSVVVGFVGLLVTGPLLGLLTGEPSGLTALNGAILLAIMALPTIISLAEDALTAVPTALLDGSLALGADRWQTLWGVAVPAARSGLFAAVLLGMGRAIGETMTVLMATGNTVAMPSGLLDPVRTLTATLAIELGEVPRGTTHASALFAVGLVLFVLTLGVNLAADGVQRRTEKRLGGGS